MRRGVFPLIGLATLLIPLSAGAQVNCEQLRDVEPLSAHYVAPAIRRAKDGIAYAAEAKTNADFFSYYLPGWARNVAGSFARLVDSRQSPTVRGDDLTETTACLRYDRILLECQIDAVRQALDAELERGSFFAIMRLQSALLFLQETLAHLHSGAADGSYADDSWSRQRLFDRDVPAERTEPLCPFHSDYTPPRLTGYGCDAYALQSINSRVPDGALPFVTAELDGLTTMIEQIETFRGLLPLVDALSENEDYGYRPFAQAEHRTIVGCQEETGVCSDNGDLVCGSDEFCASKNAGRCLRGEHPTIPKRAARGAFSYGRDHLRLLVDFVGKRIDDGLSRTFPAGWSRVEDLPEGGSDAEIRRWDDAALAGGRTSTRIYFRSVSGIQGAREGLIFPEAQDSQLEIAHALSDMRASVGELSRLASGPGGIRAFVGEFAYFLRRTCMFRPCQQTLEQIIRISLQDACFPYTNGQFLGGGPAWKACAAAACIQVDDEEGNPIELSEDCEEILPDDGE